MPQNSAYRAQLAEQQFAGNPANSELLLKEALQRNRYDAASWVQLGLLQEAENNLTDAEQSLLEGSRVDATWLPAWSLANFYFRHQESAKFWSWAHKAAQMAPDDAGPLFRLAWYVDPTVSEIEDRLELKPALQVQFINFLIAQDAPEAVQQASLLLLAGGSSLGKENLLAATEWLVEGKHAALALPVWNGMVAQHLIPYATSAAGSVTNGDFAHAPISRGFDWHLQTVAGISPFLDTHPNALGFELSGNQPDTALLLDQIIRVEAQRGYALVVDYSTEGLSSQSGLAWNITDEHSGRVLAQTADLAAQQGGQATVCFTPADGTTFVDVSLHERREPGTTRAEGKLSLHQVRFISAANASCGAH